MIYLPAILKFFSLPIEITENNNEDKKEPKILYRVRKTWTDKKSQIGAYKVYNNAVKACKEGYSVFDDNGNILYTAGGKTVENDAEYKVLSDHYLDLFGIVGEDRNKKYKEQLRITSEVLHSRRYSQEVRSLVKGLMIESYIEDGACKPEEHIFGKSITDPCLGWEKTQRLILDIAEKL